MFPQPVSMGHLLVAVVSVAGGNPYIVDHVADSLGNSWKKAVSGVNGDNTDVEIWYANSSTSGTDEVDAYIKALPGATSRFVQTYVTAAEFNGVGRFHAGHAAHSSLNGTHASGAFASTPGDLVVGGYADAGYIGNLAIVDNKSMLGTVFAGIDAIQGIQSYSVERTPINTESKDTRLLDTGRRRKASDGKDDPLADPVADCDESELPRMTNVMQV